MRKPKIGDMVWFYAKHGGLVPIAAIISHIPESDVQKFRLCAFNRNGFFSWESWEEANYSVLPRTNHWSWPEEEKPQECEHEEEDENISKCPKCKEEFHLNQDCEDTIYCNDCAHDVVEKAEELIDNIWDVIKCSNDLNVNTQFHYLFKIKDLIKEYKGIK